MNILFIGQTALAGRVEALATELAKNGHQVAVTTSQSSWRRSRGVKLIPHASLNPQKPGGLLHTLLCLFTLWKLAPDVAHVHGWLAGSLLRFATLLSPETTFIWTLTSSRLEGLHRASPLIIKLILWLNARAADAITTPTRQLQYRLLHEFGLGVIHIPDGYHPPTLPHLSRKTLGVGRGKYTLLITNETTPSRWIARAHQAAKTKSKLITAANVQGRRLTSLIHHASLIILAGRVPTDIILQAMAAGKEIIATTNPDCEETLGVTARFVADGHTRQLRQALEKISAKETLLGAKAGKRACRHFQWTRLLPEYLALYHYPSIKTVPLDSLIGVQTAQTAVR